MKARKVKGLDPDGPLHDNARRIVEVRLDELLSFGPRALDPAEVEALHDMRIAAKRLRYVLELTAPLFGPGAATGAKQAKKLQDLLGEIHDCDVMGPRVERHVEQLRGEDAQALSEAAGSGAVDLEPGIARETPNRRAYRGLETLEVYLRARRQVLYARFLRDWAQLERDDFAGALRRSLAVTVGEEEKDG